MRIAVLQSDIAWEDPAANHARVLPWIRAAAAGGARLLALPETWCCGFSMNPAKVAEPVDGPSTRFLREQAAAHGLWIAGSLPELPAGEVKPWNTLVLAGPGGEVHRYRKIHPFTCGREADHYQAGRDFVTVTVEGVRLTLFVCYDLRFADEFWANAQATDAYLVVANWPAARRHHWQALLVARAIENQAYVVGVNRVGEGGGLEYRGDSRVVDPTGEVIAAAAGCETLFFAEVDPDVVAATRRDLPFLRDRRQPSSQST